MTPLGTWAIVATVVIHGGVAAAIATLPASAQRETTVITVREVKRKPPPPPPKPIESPAIAAPAPTPTPPPVAKPPPAPKAAPAPAAPSAPPPPANIGVTMGNASGGDGPAIAAPKIAAEPKPPRPKTLDAKPAATGGCDEAIVKPKPLQVIQPAYTQAARDASVTGKVRVEIAISAAGEVTAAKVIAGLGHGLDEAALEAAKASKFSPATKCGAPVATTFTIGMRFQ